MSESLRDLVVSLSLNSDNFSRNIRSVTAQIKEAESSFRLTGAGVTSFEGTTAGLSSKLSMLEQKLGLQKSAVTQYERALETANGKLKETVQNNDKIRTSLEQAKAKYADLGSQISLAQAKYDAWYVAMGEGDARTIAAKEALAALQQEYAETGAQVKKLEGQLVATQKAMQNAADKVSRAQSNLNSAKATLKETEAAILKCNAVLRGMNWTKAGAGLTALSKELTAAGKAMTNIGKTMSGLVTAPIAALGGYAIKAAIDFEDAFAGVRKTVDATEQKFEELEADVKGMSLEVPSNTTSISAVMEVAGQLGIANDYLTEFTRTMIDLSNTTDMAATDAASNIAKFMNITGMQQGQIGNLGAAIVDLGNNFATTESSLMVLAMRLAAAGSQVGLTEPQILGFATALSAVGMEAEAGGSAFSKAMIKMQVAVETGSAALHDFAKVSGMSATQFSETWKRSPAEAIQAFLVGLSKMSEEGVSAIATLEDMGLKEVRLRDTLMRATNASKLFATAVATSNDAWHENTALTKEASTRYGTLKSQLEILKNKATLFAQTLGDDMTPTVKKLMDGVNGLMDSFTGMEKSQRDSLIRTGAAIAAIGPGLMVLGKVSTTIGKATGVLGTFATEVGEAGGGVKGLASVIGSSKLAVLGLTAALGVGVYALWDWASGAKAAREALEGMNATADKWRSTQANTVYSNEGLNFFGLNKESFASSTQSARKWLDNMIATWSDGKKETDEIVRSYAESFGRLTENTKSALEQMRVSAAESGRSELADSIGKDIDSLDAMNAEIEALLKKRQNQNLSEQDKLRLNELIDQKEAIEVKYKLTPEGTGGYAQILAGIETEIARAQARGQKDVDPSVYEKGLTATAQGYAAITEQLDAWYDAEYALIALIEDAEARETERVKLDEQYNAERKQAAEDYANTLTKVVAPVWEQGGIQQAGADMDALVQLFREYSTLGGSGYKDPAILEQMNALAEGMSKDDLLSYLGVLQQVQSLMDGGMSEGDVSALYPDIDFSAQLDQFAALADFAKERSGELAGLSDILGSIVPDEMQKIAVELDMTAAEARWAEFASNPGAITTDAIIGSYADAPEASVPDVTVDALIQAYKEIEGGASTAQLQPDDVVAQVSAYLESEGCSVAALKPDQIEAVVNGYAEATGADKSALLTAFTAHIASYEDGAAVKPTPEITAKITVTGYDLSAFNAFKEANPIEVTGIVRLSEQFENPEDVLNDPSAQFYVDGKQIEVDVVPRDRITADTLFVYDSDGTMHVLITPEIQGTTESVNQANDPLVNDKSWSMSSGILGATAISKMNSVIWSGKEYEAAAQGINAFGLGTSKVMKELQGVLDDFTAEDTAGLATFIQEIVTAIQNGEQVDEEALETLKTTIEFLRTLDTRGIGDGVTAGIGEAMSQAGWSGDAESVASNLESALNAALQINSPSRRMVPIGQGVSEGVGQGMGEYSLAGRAEIVAASAAAALKAAMSSGRFRPIGVQAMSGLALGILSGRASVVSAIRQVAQAAVTAAKSTLKIQSPSKVFEDEVGVMMTRGMVKGALNESRYQANVIRNAARYLTGAAQEGAAGGSMHSTRQTYNNQNQSVNVSVDRLAVNDRQDVRALALEIARLNRRVQFGYGGRA